MDVIRPMHPFHRTELLVGGEGFDRLAGSSACVIGLGGVGGHAADALIRAGPRCSTTDARCKSSERWSTLVSRRSPPGCESSRSGTP